MTDSSHSDLLAELDQKRRLPRFAPVVLFVSAIGIGAALVANVPQWAIIAIAVFSSLAAWYTHQRDQLRKTTVVFYDLDGDIEQVYEALHVAFSSLQQCSGTWHIEARGDVLDRKYHAGASQVVTRTGAAFRVGEPPLLKTNVPIPLIPAGRQTLALLPDRMLVFEPSGVAAVSYSDLTIVVVDTQFVEEGTPPPDATVIGSTWRYVNKSGGPDRRFSYNPELPIMRYAQLALRSSSGLNELFQFSRVEPAQSFKATLERLAAFGRETHSAQPVLEVPVDADRSSGSGARATRDPDPLLYNAGLAVIQAGEGSTSVIQRQLSVGYVQAKRILEQLEALGVLGPHQGPQPRSVLVTIQELNNLMNVH